MKQITFNRVDFTIQLWPREKSVPFLIFIYQMPWPCILMLFPKIQSQLVVNISLPGHGLVHTLVPVTDALILVGGDQIKAAFNLTLRKEVAAWTQPDTYWKRPFYNVKVTHGQDFSFSLISQSDNTNLLYQWWKLAIASHGSFYSTTLSAARQYVLTSTHLISNGTTVLSGSFSDMAVLPGLVAVASSTQVKFYLPGQINTTTPLHSALISQTYSKIEMCQDSASGAILFAGQRGTDVDYGSLPPIPAPPSPAVLLTLAGNLPNAKLLSLGNTCNFIFVGVGTQVRKVSSSGSLVRTISVGFQPHSIGHVIDFQSRPFLVIGGNSVLQVVFYCRSPCQTCSGPGSQACLSCISGFSLEGSVCVSQDCDSGLFYERRCSDDDCQECNPCPGAGLCAIGPLFGALEQYTCNSPGTYLFALKCQYCPKHYIPDDASRTCTWVNCPSGMYWSELYVGCIICTVDTFVNLSTGACQNCPQLCASCDAAICFACKRDVFMCQGNCVYSCPFFYQTNYATGSCILCTLHYDPVALVCLDTCPTSTYSDASNVCLKCKDPCSRCLSQVYCVECKVGYALAGVCVSACPYRYTTKGSVCQHCSNYYFDVSKECLFNCPQKTYGDSSMVCSPCHDLCKSCTGPSTLQCTSCTKDVYKLGGSCLSPCPSAFYGNPMDGLCHSCSPNCFKCKNQDVCFKCWPPFLLLSNACVGLCPTQYFSNETHCLPCSDFCVKISAQPSYWLQPYSNLKIVLSFSAPVAVDQVRQLCRFVLSSKVQFLGLRALDLLQVQLQFKPANLARYLANEQVRLVLDDNNQTIRADKKYLFAKASLATHVFTFNYISGSSSWHAAISQFAAVTQVVYSWPSYARAAASLAIYDFHSQIVAVSSVPVSKQEVELVNFINLGTQKEMRFWRSALKNRSKSRRMLVVHTQSRLLPMRHFHFGLIAVTLISAILVSAIARSGLRKMQRLGTPWPLSDLAHRLVGQILSLDLAFSIIAGSRVDQIVAGLGLGWVIVYLMLRTARFHRRRRTRVYRRQMDGHLAQFRLELGLFRFRDLDGRGLLARVILAYCGPLYLNTSFAFSLLRAFFLLSYYYDLLSLSLSQLLLTALQLIIVVAFRPFKLAKHNIAAAGVQAAQALIYLCWTFSTQSLDEIAIYPQASKRYELVGWISLGLCLLKTVVQSWLCLSLLLQVTSNGVDEYREQVRAAYKELIANNPELPVQQLNRMIVAGNLNEADESTLLRVECPVLLVKFIASQKKLFIRRVQKLALRQRHNVQQNNIQVKRFSDFVLPQDELQVERLVEYFTALSRQSGGGRERLQVAEFLLSYSMEVEQRQLKLGCRVPLKPGFDLYHCKVLLNSQTLTFKASHQGSPEILKFVFEFARGLKCS